MATETERLVYIIEVQDNSSAVLKGVSLNIAKMAETALSVFKKIGETTVDFMKDSVKAYAAFEDALGGARKTMDLTGDQTEALGKKIREMAIDFKDGGLAAGIAHKDLAAIAEMAGQMNISFTENAKDFETFVKTVAMASGAFKMSADATATALGQIRNNYKLTMDELPALAGAIDIVGNASLANEQQIMQFMTEVGAMAEKAGMTTQQMIALGGVFGDMGVPMNIAGTAMTQTFVMLRTELDRFAEVLGAGGISKAMLETAVRSGDMSGALMLVAQGLSKIGEKDALAAETALKDLGFEGKRVLVAFNALLAGQQKYIDYQSMIADPLNNSKSLLESYKSALDTMNERFKQAGVIINEVRMVIGEKLSNAIEVVLEKNLIPFLKNVAVWIQQSPVAKALFEAMAKAIQWIGDELAKAGNALLNWIQSIDTATAGSDVKEWFANLGKDIVKLWENIKGKDWGKMFNDAIIAVKTLSSLLIKTGDILGQMATANENAFAPFADIIAKVNDGWEILRYTVQETGTTIQKTIDGSIMAVGKLADWVNEKLTGAFEKAIVVLEKLGVVSYGRSVFPDMADWADIAASSVGGITTQANVLTETLSYVDPVLQNMTAQLANFKLPEMALPQLANMPAGFGDKNATINDLLRNPSRVFGSGLSAQQYQSGLEMIQRQDQQMAAASAGAPAKSLVTAGGWSTSVNITVNAGANLVDDYSLGKFAQTIGQKIQETSGRTVSSGWGK